MPFTTRVRIVPQVDSKGRAVYKTDIIACGLTLSLSGVLLFWIGTQMQLPTDIDLGVDWFVLVCYAAGIGLAVVGAILCFQRRSLTFDMAQKILFVEKSGLLGKGVSQCGYAECSVQVRKTTRYNPAGRSWHGYALKIFWPDGDMILARNRSLDRVQEAVGIFEESTGLTCQQQLDQEFDNFTW